MQQLFENVFQTVLHNMMGYETNSLQEILAYDRP
jgi:hypothetical protein